IKSDQFQYGRLRLFVGLRVLPPNVHRRSSVGIVDLSGIRDLVETIPIVSLQRILQKTTTVLRRELRGNDVIGRWNDNSFIIMLPNTNGAAAKTIFERIFQSLSGQIELDELNIVIDLAPQIGGAEYSSGISTL
ncbi:MAG: diguanylate cyclase, partial [Cellulomonadaceae bacterium]|nr:diguanylate cyclase [Cellulomonadaceae bacterium]